jgi:hypothetical protein
LQCRWAAINKDCTKFNGIFVQLKAIPRSGWNYEKFEEEALKLYKEEVKEDFKFLSCWVYLKEKPKWVNTSGFIRPAVAKNVISKDIQPVVEDSSSLKKVEKEENDVKLERPMGQKAAKLHRTLADKQASADERTATALELRAESHKDYLHYKIMSKMGDSEIAKQWFQLMAEEALLEKKKKLTEKKRLLEQQEAREAKALKKSSPPTTIECGSNTSAASAVSSAEGAEVEEESAESAGKENVPPKITNVVCCAGDYCFFGEHIREPLSVVCGICKLRCHKECSDEDKEGQSRFCDLCGRKKILESV